MKLHLINDDEDDDFLVAEENKIVEPDLDIHLFGISKDVPFDNIGVTSLVPHDVLEGEDVDVNADGFDSDTSYDETMNPIHSITFDLNEPIDSSKNDKAAQNGRTPKSLTLEIHHGGCFTPIHSRSYIGGQVSSVNVDDIDEFCLHDHKDMVVKLGYGLADLMYYHFLIPRSGLDYGLHPLNVDVDMLEMAKYVKDYKIILVYIEHGSSIFVTPKKGVSIAVDNHLRKGPIEIDSSPNVNRNLTPMCHRNLTKEWEQVSSKSLSIDLDEILGDYANTGKQITRNGIIGKQMVVHVGNSSTVNDVLDLEMLFKTEGVGPVGKFKEVEIDADNESEEESDTEGDYTSGRWEVRTLIEDHNCLQSREIKACASRFLSDHIIKSPTTNHDIHVRAVQDQIYKELYSLLRESAQDLINQNQCTAVRIDVQEEPNPESITRAFRRVYVCLGALKQGFKAYGKEILGLDGCFMSGPWPGQILTAIGVDANNGIYPVAYVIVEAETKATSVGEFNKKMAELKSFNSASYDWLMKILAEQWSRAYFLGKAKCDILLNNICEVFNRQLVDGRDRHHYLLGIYQRVLNEEDCSSSEIKATTVIVPPLYKPQVGMSPKKMKKSHDEIANESCSSGKLSRKGKSVRCGKCGNMGHNRKGCRGQGGATQAGGSSARNVSGQGGARRTAGARNVSGQASIRQATSARTVSGQAGGASNGSS
ncbi:hypothetical protein Tco_0194591 [Tanacetum coccineum]